MKCSECRREIGDDEKVYHDPYAPELPLCEECMTEEGEKHGYA
jgi:hypothetical protein